MLEPLSIFLAGVAITITAIATSIVTITTALSTILAATIAGLATISGFASALASILPPPNENATYYKPVYKYVNYVAFNIGLAKNNIQTAIAKEEEK